LIFAGLISRNLLRGGNLVTRSLPRSFNSRTTMDTIPRSHYEATVNWINQETVVLVVQDTTSLGGFLGRKSDGEPGIKSLSLGIQRHDDLASTWKFMRPPVSSNLIYE